MIPSGLDQLFGTLAVGLFAMLVLAMGHWMVTADPRGFFKWLTVHPIWPHDAFPAAILLIASLGFGVLVQGWTDQLTDTDRQDCASSLGGRMTGSLLDPGCLMPSESDLRFSALFAKDTSAGLEESRCKLNGLGRDVFGRRRPELDALIQDQGVAQANEFLDNPCDHVNKVPGLCEGKWHGAQIPKEIRGWVNRIYYAAKNWCYGEPTLFEELELVQRRIDLSRSALALAIWGIWISGACTVLAMVLGIRGIRHRLLVNGRFGSLAILDRLDRYGVVLRMARTVVPLGAVVFISHKGYRHAEVQFNERAIGYYFSHLDREAKPKREAASIFVGRNGHRAELWFGTSAEYRAIARQTFVAVRGAVARRMERSEVDKPAAVVMDLDETVFDNSEFNLRLAAMGLSYSESDWEEWTESCWSRVKAVPGSVEFVNDMLGQGVAVLFVTNRNLEQVDETMMTLREGLGIDLHAAMGLATGGSVVFARIDSASKQARLDAIRREYNVVAFIGDNLADFGSELEQARFPTMAARRIAVDSLQHVGKWGTEWFVLPNPMYGDWEQLAKRDALGIREMAARALECPLGQK